MINPGDKIGDFLITSGDGEDIIHVSKLHCPFDSSTGTESCKQPVGTNVNVGEGVFDDNPSSGKILDEKPGKITVRSTGVVGGDPFDYTAIITFTVP